VYPALREMEKDELIKSERLPGTRGPERSIYSLTAAGIEKLTAWVAKASPRPAIKDEQILRVLCFDLLPRETALQQIREVRADHQAQLDARPNSGRGSRPAEWCMKTSPESAFRKAAGGRPHS
jgi:DNA-binding PadR family transcriptional regulator